jgi:hypothetical protein
MAETEDVACAKPNESLLPHRTGTPSNDELKMVVWPSFASDGRPDDCAGNAGHGGGGTNGLAERERERMYSSNVNKEC